MYRSWSLEGVRAENRRPFIIQCLQEYIDQVEDMDIRESCYGEDIDICMIADLYRAIIEELSV